jgi:uncharacterized membrane protein YesL
MRPFLSLRVTRRAVQEKKEEEIWKLFFQSWRKSWPIIAAQD